MPQIPPGVDSQNTIWPGSITQPAHVEKEGQVLVHGSVPGLQGGL